MTLKRLGVQKIQLGDLLQRMGWKQPTPIVQYGTGGNKDFGLKRRKACQKKSIGSVSDVFKPRSAAGSRPG